MQNEPFNEQPNCSHVGVLIDVVCRFRFREAVTLRWADEKHKKRGTKRRKIVN